MVFLICFVLGWVGQRWGTGSGTIWIQRGDEWDSSELKNLYFSENFWQVFAEGPLIRLSSGWHEKYQIGSGWQKIINKFFFVFRSVYFFKRMINWHFPIVFNSKYREMFYLQQIQPEVSRLKIWKGRLLKTLS